MHSRLADIRLKPKSSELFKNQTIGGRVNTNVDRRKGQIFADFRDVTNGWPPWQEITALFSLDV